jgi:hypothetical protein
MNNDNDNIRINIREPVHPYGGICGCPRCLGVLGLLQCHQDEIGVQIQIIYNDALRSIRMNQLFGFFGEYDTYSLNLGYEDELINSLFQQSQGELERNEKINIDIQSDLFKNTEKIFTNCSICSDEYKDEDMVSTLNCKHIFHTNCIKEWGHYNPICPVCKANINTQ